MKKQRSKSSTTPVLPSLTDVLREVNETVLSPKAVRDQEKQLGKLAREVDSEDAEWIRDGAMELDFWRGYAADERARIGGLFQQLAERGELSGPDLREQFENFRAGATSEITTGTGKAGPYAEPIIKFCDSDPQATLDARQAARDARLAFVLIWLAGQPDDGYRVMQCAHKGCGRLFVRKPAKGPKSPACPLHVNAYRQARFRDQHSRNKKPTKSKTARRPK
jgi:hypothetical protein